MSNVKPRHLPIDYARYSGASSSEVKFGLPDKVAFCNSCVISNQRPVSAVEYKHTKDSKKGTINFDEAGVCDACRFAERKRSGIDWEAKDLELRELCDRRRSRDGAWDCVVPGSGGKDSFYAAHKLKYEYGMNPLTVTWAPHLYTDWGWRNHQAWIHAGFDNMLVHPNGRVHRLFTRLAVENLLHPFQPFIIGQKSLAPKVALKYGIKLIFYGENEVEYGNPMQQYGSKQKAKYFAGIDKDSMVLGGERVADLKAHFGVRDSDLHMYLPADQERIDAAGVEVHYMGYYLRWHPQSCYYYAVEHGNFEAAPERTEGTYSKYNSIDDKMDDLHYYTTYIKFGIGRATYDASQEVRSGDITREEGVALVRRFDGEFPTRFIDDLFAYLSLPEKDYPAAAKMFEQPMMDRPYFDHLCDRFRSPHLWRWDNGAWVLRHRVFDEPWATGVRQEDEAATWRGNAYQPHA